MLKNKKYIITENDDEELKSEGEEGESIEQGDNPTDNGNKQKDNPTDNGDKQKDNPTDDGDKQKDNPTDDGDKSEVNALDNIKNVLSDCRI